MSDLPTYDPDWEHRFDRAESILEALPESAWQVRLTAVKALQRAHDAQFRTAAEMAEFQFPTLRQSAFQAGFMLALQPLGPDATLEDLGRVWREAEDAIAAARRDADRRPIAQPPGLTAFGPDSKAGVSRSVETFEYAILSREPQVWTALVERRGAETRLCLVALERRQSVFNGFEHLATAAYNSLVAPLHWRPWACANPRRVQFYSYKPWALHDTGAEVFNARHLTWKRGRYIEDFEKRRSFETVPASLAELDPRPPKSEGLMLFPTSKGEEAAA